MTENSRLDGDDAARPRQPLDRALFTKRGRVPGHVVMRVVDGATVLLNAQTGRYFKLDDLGTRVWGALVSSVSIRSACDALLAEYSVPPSELERDVEALIERLVVNGLLELTGA